MEPVTSETLTEFLTRLGERYSDQAALYLLGGSALLLLGSPRQTLDIDYTTDLNPQQQKELETIMNQLAAQYRLDIESVPIAEFVPLPLGSETRRRFIGRFGKVDVYVYDLYTIGRGIEAFNDQPNRQDHFLQKNGECQGNVAGNPVTVEQGQHARGQHQGDRDDPKARQPPGNEPGLEEQGVVQKCTQAEGEHCHQISVVADASRQPLRQ